MDIRNDILHCYGNPIHLDIIAYDFNARGCLCLASNGETHYIANPNAHSHWTNDDFVNRPEALDIYLFDLDEYVFVFRDRIEICKVGSPDTEVIKMKIRPDFQMFRVSRSYCQFCYINGGILYLPDGSIITKIPECKFVWSVYYDALLSQKYCIYEIDYVDHDDNPKILASYFRFAAADIEKVLSTSEFDVYLTLSNMVVLYHHSTGRSTCAGRLPGENIDKYQFETNGYQWTVSDGHKKYYHYCCETPIEIPIDAKLCWPGHRTFTAVPTKSAMF